MVADHGAAIRWLHSEAGVALLAEAAKLPPDRLTRLQRLRRQVAPDIAAAAVELLELRQRARRKFARADTMVFTPEGLEQATGDVIARYRAARFPVGATVLDACCGIGGDALALAERGPVVAVDSNPVAVACVRANASALGVPSPLRVLCADVTRLDLARLRAGGIDAACFDPSRRTDSREGGRRRVRAASDFTPPLAFLETLRAHLPDLAVKVSPALDDAVLRAFPARVEFLSDRGECKEAVLWFGALADGLPDAPSGYCATLLHPDAPPFTLAPFPCPPPPLSAPRQWLYEPDPAVIRAHLLPQIAALLSAAQLDSQIAYLTADTCQPMPFATAYRVLDWLPFSLKQTQARLRALGRRVVAIKRRGVPLEPDALRTRLTGSDSGAAAVVVLTRHADAPIALLCEPPV